MSKASKQRQRERAAERKAEIRRKQQRRRVRNYSIAALVAVVVVGAFVAALIADQQAEDIEGLQEFGDLGRDHVEETVQYEQLPPVGGAHSATPMACGIYAEPLPDENVVHSLEHGAVWITYRPDLADAEVAALEDFVRGQSEANQDFLLLSPYEGNPGPVVATAWGRQLVLDGPDDPRLAEFTETFVRGSQSPEPGAACDGVTMSRQ